jgi:hypothetical protein
MVCARSRRAPHDGADAARDSAAGPPATRADIRAEAALAPWEVARDLGDQAALDTLAAAARSELAAMKRPPARIADYARRLGITRR